MDLISGLRGRTGMTTVLTTHHLDEAERLCDRVAVMHQGKIMALDRPARLLAGFGAVLAFAVFMYRWPRYSPTGSPPRRSTSGSPRCAAADGGRPAQAGTSPTW